MPDALVLLHAVLTDSLPALVPFADPVPEDEEVRAGWVALAIFLGMAAAVVVLAFSLVKQLGKAQQAKNTGVYGDAPAAEEQTPDTGTSDD